MLLEVMLMLLSMNLGFLTVEALREKHHIFTKSASLSFLGLIYFVVLNSVVMLIGG